MRTHYNTYTITRIRESVRYQSFPRTSIYIRVYNKHSPIVSQNNNNKYP